MEVAQTRLYVLKGGGGNPLLVLHGVEGPEGWLPFHDALAEHATVYAPSHPGYGHTECPGYLIRCFVADTEEKAQAEGRNFFWQKGACTSSRGSGWLRPAMQR